MSQKALMQAVQEQRSKLLNVLGVVQCMQVAVRDGPPPELEGAVQLVEENLQDILEALEELVLERVAKDQPQP